jgi:HK97 gp10 family phage protein|nr:MAG TPA: putative tail component [Caudoviricetes sp.]
MPKIKLEGMEKFQVKLKKNVQMSDVKRVVKANGAALQEAAQRKAPVGTPQSTGIPGYVGGTLKRSIVLEIRDGGLTAEVEPTAEYATYVEHGTRFMNAQPYMRPSYNQQKEKFKSDMKKLVR